MKLGVFRSKINFAKLSNLMPHINKYFLVVVLSRVLTSPPVLGEMKYYSWSADSWLGRIMLNHDCVFIFETAFAVLYYFSLLFFIKLWIHLWKGQAVFCFSVCGGWLCVRVYVCVWVGGWLGTHSLYMQYSACVSVIFCSTNLVTLKC